MSMLCTCIRGQMSNTFFLSGGQMSTPVNHLGGKCPCIPFFIGGQMSEGGNVLHSFFYNEAHVISLLHNNLFFLTFIHFFPIAKVAQQTQFIFA